MWADNKWVQRQEELMYRDIAVSKSHTHKQSLYIQ